MVQVLVNLLGVTVLLEQTAQHTGAADPQNLGGQASLPGSVALTCVCYVYVWHESVYVSVWVCKCVPVFKFLVLCAGINGCHGEMQDRTK
jgi:hypothetical protein